MAVDVDLRSLNKGLRAMERASLNLRPVWRQIRKPMRQDQKEHMRKETDSSGAKWKPLAASTKDRRLSKGGRAGKFTKRGKLKKRAQRKLNRILSQRLVSGARFRSKPDRAEIQSKVRWAGVHQGGGTVGKGSRISAREFFWISDELAELASDKITEHLAETFNRGG